MRGLCKLLMVGMLALPVVGYSQETLYTDSSEGVKVVGADAPIPIGELVVLTAELKNPPKDIKEVNYSWTILPKRDAVLWPDQTKIVFGTGNAPREYTIVLTAAVLSAGDEMKLLQSYTTVTTVKVGGSDPVKPVDPVAPVDPVTPVDPIDPNPLTGISKDVYQWISLVKTTPLYTNEMIKADAAKLAVSFEAVAASVAAGIYKDYNEILTATRNSNRQAIANRDEWLPWFEKLSAKLKESYADGSIKTNDQISQAWRDIAKGLNKAK